MLGATLDYSTVEEQIDAMTRLRLATNGSLHAMNEQEAIASATTSVARGYHPQGTGRIVLSRMSTPPVHTQTHNIQCPTLVLHADQDPIFPLEHGEELARRIPNAQLRVLQGAGHNHPHSLQPIIVDHIASFLSEPG